jgi:AcrR family transcriptional regulator
VTEAPVAARPARSEEAILRAALELVAEHGVGGLTVDAVAARAGVGKQTIYRHWGSRARLVHAAIACVVGPPSDIDSGSVRADVLHVLGQLHDHLRDEATSRVLSSLIDAAARDPELAALRERHICEKRAGFAEVLQRGVDRGELRDDVDLAVLSDLLVGPIFCRELVVRLPLQRREIEQQVDLVLRAAAVEPQG